MKIICTGCQRSSTRFMSQYLAKKYKFDYIDEKDYNIRDYDKLKELLKYKKNAVIHGPAIKHLVEQFKKDYPDSKIIWMYRDPKETKKSMERINWQSAHTELDNMKPIFDKYGMISITKIFWELEDILMKTILLSKILGKIYHSKGIVDKLIDMKNIEHLEGFKKHEYKIS